MTVLDQNLFIVNDRSPVMEVYDVTKFCFKSQLKLKTLVEPTEIVSCRKTHQVYVFDYKGKDKSKHVIRVDQDGITTMTWSTGDDHGCLSVTNEATLILTVFWENKLNEYASNGNLIREIKLPESLNHPRHSLKLNSGNFLVCNGRRVSILNLDGNIIGKSFDANAESELVYLLLRLDGSVIVVDENDNSSRVILLNSNLEFVEDLLSKAEHRLNVPSRICLDLTNDRLLVVDNNVNIPQVQVFQVEK